jgi:hypothetical protein
MMVGMGSAAWLVLGAALVGVHSATAMEEISDARDLTFKVRPTQRRLCSTSRTRPAFIFARLATALRG